MQGVHGGDVKKNANRSGLIALLVVGAFSAFVWVRGGPAPPFVFGGAAVLWLCSLMIKGILSPPFKPSQDSEGPIK